MTERVNLADDIERLIVKGWQLEAWEGRFTAEMPSGFMVIAPTLERLVEAVLKLQEVREGRMSDVLKPCPML
jgi:hypothetical protein